MAAESNRETSPAGLLVGHGGDVRAHCTGWVGEGGAELDGDSLYGVGVVGCPDLGEVLQNAWIEAAAARGAAFPEDVGEAGCQGVEDVVHAQDVLVVRAGGGHLVHAAVVVPFDVGDARGAVDDVADGVDDEVLHFGQSQVQHELVPLQSARVCAGVEYPVRVFMVQSRVGVDHLWFHPEPEAQVSGCVGGLQVGDIVHQGLQAIWKLRWIGHPVTQTGIVRYTWILLSEPAIVHDEQFRSQCGRFLCQSEDAALVIVEAQTFPAVEQHGTVACGELALDEVLPVEAMEGARHAANSIPGVYRDTLGGGEGLAGA